jgi:hypothetical protein
MTSADNHLWMTPIDRALFGFNYEIDCDPSRFFNFEYIQGLINREAEVLRLHAKVFAGLLFLNTISLFYVQGIKLDLQIFGQKIQQIPASTEVLCLFLGLNLFGFAIHSLDVMLFSRMRYSVIHKLLSTDLTNMATAHLKGSGVWIDLLTPRFIGYSSGKAHNTFSSAIAIIFLTFYGALFLASGTSLFELYIFGLSQHEMAISWPTIISTAGLTMGGVGTLFFFIVQFMPFSFSLPNSASSADKAKQKALFPNASQ